MRCPYSEPRTGPVRIAERLMSLPEVERASTVMAFWSFGSEPDTAPLIAALHAVGVRVALPRIVEVDLELRRCAPGDPVTRRRSVRGARRRDGDRPVRDRRGRHAGRRLRPTGRRVGYGGGFYDRFLPQTPAGLARVGVGVRRAARRRRPVPNGHFDLRVDAS